jgi:cobalt/nickel transport system permease protein
MMALVSLSLPLAVHISDGVLSVPWLFGGFFVAGLLALLAAQRMRDEEIPRIAVLGAAFFVASLLHLPLGPTSVHLLLNGLVGVVLGRRAPLAILIGVGLQAILGHGGFTTIGVNAVVLSLPALLAGALFAALRRLPFLWLSGCLIGMTAVLVTLILQAGVLLWGGAEDWHQIVWLLFYAHLPLVAVEGVVLGFTVQFLARVKPEMLGLRGQTARVCLAALTLLYAVNAAQAHRACADFTVRDERQIQIEGWFDPGDVPMRGAKVEVFRPEHRLLVEGKMDDRGIFLFHFSEPEELEVIVNGGVGHRASFVIPREKLERTADIGSEGNLSRPSTETPGPTQRIHHGESGREQLKDALLGVTFLLALGAFVLSWRISRKLQVLQRAHAILPPETGGKES